MTLCHTCPPTSLTSLVSLAISAFLGDGTKHLKENFENLDFLMKIEKAEIDDATKKNIHPWIKTIENM